MSSTQELRESHYDIILILAFALLEVSKLDCILDVTEEKQRNWKLDSNRDVRREITHN